MEATSSSLGSCKTPYPAAATARTSNRMVVAASEVVASPDSTSGCEGSSSSSLAAKAAAGTASAAAAALLLHSKARAAVARRCSPEFHQSGENVGKSSSKDASFNETTTASSKLTTITSTMTVNDNTNEADETGRLPVAGTSGGGSAKRAKMDSGNSGSSAASASAASVPSPSAQSAPATSTDELDCINLDTKVFAGLSAKMRLKRQIKALAEAAAVAEAATASTAASTAGSASAAASVTSRTLSCSSSGSSSTSSSPAVFPQAQIAATSAAATAAPAVSVTQHAAAPPKRAFDPQTSALHQLAEAAELKQEEEMMELRGSSSHQQRLPSPSSQNQSLLSRMPPAAAPLPRRPSGPVITTPLPSRAEYEVTHQQQPPCTTTTVVLPTSPLPPNSLRGAPLDLSSAFPPHDQLLPRLSSSSHPPLPQASSSSANEPVESQRASAAGGVSRQQLINSPCPICGDKISGFHYGIFSCESCKGFFKRTVQNKKNYVCLRGGQCVVSIATRKKCPACRFKKCLETGMKLEAIREDRTRGGRSTYQCSYNFPAPAAAAAAAGAGAGPRPSSSTSPETPSAQPPPTMIPQPASVIPRTISTSWSEQPFPDSSRNSPDQVHMVRLTPPPPPPLLLGASPSSLRQEPTYVPPLLKEIMDVEHLWFSQTGGGGGDPPAISGGGPGDVEDDPLVQTLANMADKRLYKLVKWCKSLPLFKNIVIDDQIALLINAWCELLVFSCCYRSIGSPGLVRVSNDKSLSLESARSFGIERCIDKMLNFSDQLRRLKVDYYEYVSMKVIVLLTSDASGLKEPEHVRSLQERVVRELQQYTTANYPTMPSKFSDLLLRIPELHRVCQVGRDMLTPKGDGQGESPGFNLLMELLRGDH